MRTFGINHLMNFATLYCTYSLMSSSSVLGLHLKPSKTCVMSCNASHPVLRRVTFFGRPTSVKVKVIALKST